MNIRQCATVQDAERGTGFKLVTREILLYQDPKTGEVLEKWENPWTGEEVDVLHVANDPVNSGPFFPKGPNGEPFPFFGTVKEGDWWITSIAEQRMLFMSDGSPREIHFTMELKSFEGRVGR